jgi:TPR repeat protein
MRVYTIWFTGSYERFNTLDDFKALKFFQKACDLNNGTGCSNLGFMYEEGKGVRKSNESPRLEQPTPRFKPHAFWKNLSALKSSCLTPLPLPYFKALKFYQKACDLNDGSGCSNLGFMHYKGKGVKQDDL